jgi:hypothetical protein
MDQDRNNREEGTLEKLGEQLGAAAGNTLGRGADIATNVVGTFIGSALSNLGEWWSTPDATRAAGSFDQDRDRSCREHFESQGMSGNRDYDQVRPLYQFGHVAGQNPDYRGRDFDDVEPDLRGAYEQGAREKSADWPEVRGFVGFGYAQDNPSQEL